MGKIRGTHSSPGVYTKFTDLQTAADTIGITTLGLVGETLKGPAFEPMMVSSYTQFKTYFGGTSAEKYPASQYPRYELPYIAKSYLTASDQLYVCRVLGLSGYNAGPAWVIKAKGTNFSEDFVVAVIRSRGQYKEYANIGTICDPINVYDKVVFDCANIELTDYVSSSMILNKCEGVINNSSTSTEENEVFKTSALNLGQFTIVCTLKDGSKLSYPVSLNNGAKDYIYNVLGSSPIDGEAPIYVEELYDYYLQDLIAEGKVRGISKNVTKYADRIINAICDPVDDFVQSKSSVKNLVGKTYLCADDIINDYGFATIERYISTTGETEDDTITVENPLYIKALDEVRKIGFTFLRKENNEYIEWPMELGGVYEVKQYSDSLGKKQYAYFEVTTTITNESGETETVAVVLPNSSMNAETVGDDDKIVENPLYACKVKSTDALWVRYDGERTLSIIIDNFSDYHDTYRCATTPWIVSEVKGGLMTSGSSKDVILNVKRLFRFHTITDGNAANTQVKISITNIRPDVGTFDVQIRDYYDTDAAPTILESYRNLTMVKGTKNFIGMQIGTIDGEYEVKSKYVMLEVIANDMTETCVPSGFLGYPTRTYQDLIAPTFTYNTTYQDNIKDKKQYFGLSDLTGVDYDMLSYKGKNAYTEDYTSGYTNHFHLDSTLSKEVVASLKENGNVQIRIDDELSDASRWTTVGINNTSDKGTKLPVIASEDEMIGTIFENVNLRKFTVYPYGGFDGWDVYRKARTTNDNFKANKYKGEIRNGYGATFSQISDVTTLGLSGNCITSDYYAFLAGAKQFQIPEKYVINLFATPGIDYVNDNLLSQEILSMIEEQRGDSLYIMTTPDKPFGASDSSDEMYSSAEVSDNLEDAGIDSYYAATYYPWIKFEDKENYSYINLPVTKDALRNMADVDNKKYPWYSPAGLERGKVECKKMHFFAKLEDEDNVYDSGINPVKTFSKDGVKIWGNKTMYSQDTPMNRINVVRLMLYMRKLVIEASLKLIFEPNDTTLKKQFEDTINPILKQIKNDRGIIDYKLEVQQTPEMMDAHELQARLFVKPTPALEYIEIEFVVTPQGVDFNMQ